MQRGCEKCGSEEIKGPKYDEGRDVLRYWCAVCRYEWTRAPKDHPTQQVLPEQK